MTRRSAWPRRPDCWAAIARASTGLLRSGDLVAAEADDDGASGPLRIDRSSLERWMVAGGDGGRPLSPRNAWALIGLASGEQPFSETCVGLLEHAEELSRTRARLAREKLVDLAPRLRWRATLIVRQVPTDLRVSLEQDAAVVRTGVSTAAAYGWDELIERPDSTWRLDAYVSIGAFEAVQERLNRLDIDADSVDDAADRDAVLLRVVDEPWPFPPHYPLAPQPLAALDLLDYPDQVGRRIGRDVLNELEQIRPAVLARRSAKARAMSGPLAGKIVELRTRRGPRPRVEGDPKTDTRAAAAHVVGYCGRRPARG